MFNVESAPVSGEPSVPSTPPPNRKRVIIAAGVLLLCIVGVVFVGLALRSPAPESALNLPHDAALASSKPPSSLLDQTTPTETALPPNPETTEIQTATHTFNKIKSLMLNNRLATAGITLAIVAVLVGVVVTAVLLSTSQVETVIDPMPEPGPEPEPEIKPVDPHPVIPEEEESGLSLGAWIGIGIGCAFAVALLAFAAATFFWRRKNQVTVQNNLETKTNPKGFPQPVSGVGDGDQHLHQQHGSTANTVGSNIGFQFVPFIFPPSDESDSYSSDASSDDNEPLTIKDSDFPALSTTPLKICKNIDQNDDTFASYKRGDFTFDCFYCYDGLSSISIRHTGSPIKGATKYRFSPTSTHPKDLLRKFNLPFGSFNSATPQNVNFGSVDIPDSLTLSLKIETKGKWMETGKTIEVEFIEGDGTPLKELTVI